MKKPTMKEMLAVPAEFRAMNDEELNAVFEECRTGVRRYSDRYIARHEQYRREAVKASKRDIEDYWPDAIAEYRRSILAMEARIESEKKKLAKLEAQP